MPEDRSGIPGPAFWAVTPQGFPWLGHEPRRLTLAKPRYRIKPGRGAHTLAIAPGIVRPAAGRIHRPEFSQSLPCKKPIGGRIGTSLTVTPSPFFTT